MSKTAVRVASTTWSSTQRRKWPRAGVSSASALARAAEPKWTTASTSSQPRCAGRLKPLAPSATRSAPKWKSASTSTSARRPPTQCRWAVSWPRCAPFSSRTRCGRRTPLNLRYLRSQIPVPIATGEQLASKWEWQVLIEQDLIDYCRVDLCICGGLTESRKIAGWCETHYIEQVPHNPLGPVSTAACLHFDLSTPLFAVQELTWRPGVLEGVVSTDMRLEWGNLYSGGSPGLGVDLNDEAALALPFQLPGLRILRREDGSVSDW